MILVPFPLGLEIQHLTNEAQSMQTALLGGMKSSTLIGEQV